VENSVENVDKNPVSFPQKTVERKIGREFPFLGIYGNFIMEKLVIFGKDL
jgi:hypothetical protein